MHRNALFWVSIFTPLLFAVFLAFPLSNTLEFDFTSKGYSHFIETFKLPLWVASGSLLFGVMVGRFHSSEQRAITIKQSITQNNFSNYLNHRDHFQKYIKPIADIFSVEIDPYKIYGIIFSSSTPREANVNLSEGIYDFFQEKFESEFWVKMKFSNPNYSKQEVNIYFPRFAKSIGINMEGKELQEFNELRDILVKIRKIYRRAMEYGMTRHSPEKYQTIEEHGFAMLNGEFLQWSNENGFNKRWS